jgi:hypothetical protein
MVGPWVSLVLAVGRAGAQDPPDAASGDPAAPSGRGLLFQIYDPGAALLAPPEVTLTDAAGVARAASPRDDGAMPDVHAGDGVYSAPVPDVAAGPLTAVIQAGADSWTVAGEQRVDDPLPRLIVIVEAGEARIAPADAPIPGSPFAQGHGGDPSSDQPMTGPAVGPGPAGPAPGPGLLGGVVAPVLISSLAFGAGLLVGRRGGSRGPRLQALARPGGGPLPPTGERRVAWSLPAGGDRVEQVAAVARAAAGRGLVLLAPAPDRRGALADRLAGWPAVLLPAADRLDPDTLLRALRGLQAVGPALLLIDGPDALEAPLDEEGPEAVLKELLDGGHGRGAVVVLVEAASSLPTAAALGPELG